MKHPRAEGKGSVVLLSGGMDSGTCLALARRRPGRLHALTLQYGQRHPREIHAARRLAKTYRVDQHVVLRLPLGPLLSSALTDKSAPLPKSGSSRKHRIPATYVPARNTIFLSIALGYAESQGLDSIYLGVNAIDYSGYPDCRPEFLRAFRRVAKLATRVSVEARRPIRIVAPLLHLSKREIVALGNRLGVPWKQTWSCYEGDRRPCGRCDACRLRERGFREEGAEDPLIAFRTVERRPRGRQSGRG